jgi:hypothetical protein
MTLLSAIDVFRCDIALANIDELGRCDMSYVTAYQTPYLVPSGPSSSQGFLNIAISTHVVMVTK